MTTPTARKRAQYVARRLSWDKFNDDDIYHLEQEILAAERAAAKRQRERDAEIALSPYADAVGARAGMEPREVGERIAAAIRALEVDDASYWIGVDDAY